jgi:dihydrofolate reductase
MAELIYSTIASLDGYVADRDGNFDWAAPDHEVHTFVNDLERSVGTYLYGRRMYETMGVWEHLDSFEDPSPAMIDYGRIWRAADKVVYSASDPAVVSARTRVETRFEPDAVRAMKEAATAAMTVGGPHLAAQAIRAGLVDEIQLLVVPVVVGGGNQALPDDVHLALELTDERRFANGTVHLRYRVVA